MIDCFMTVSILTELASPYLSVVVPVHNEEENIVPLITEIHQALEGVVGFEVIYVDDGSTDHTLKKLKEATQPYQYHKISSLLKLIMLVGILSMVFL